MARASAAGGAARVRGTPGAGVPQPVRSARAGGTRTRGWHRQKTRLRKPWTGECCYYLPYFFNRVFKLNPTDRVISKLCNHIKTKYNTSVAKRIQLESG